MEIQSVAREAQKSSRRWLIVSALAFVQILLMMAAFVTGRMLAEQNQRANGQSFATGLASELPKDPAAGTGTVQKIQDNSITLTQGGGSGGGPSGGSGGGPSGGSGGGPSGGSGGGPGGPPGQGGSSGSTTSSQTTVMVTSETKYYKGSSSGGGNSGMPGGQSQSQVVVQSAKLADIKVGNTLMVWGVKSGDTITAEVIYIQDQSFGP